MAIPTAEEVGTTLRKADAAFGTYIALCAFAGLRRGEAAALRVIDIDFLRKEIHVCRQVQWTDDGRLEIRAPKYGSERTVYIPDRLVTMLAEHVRLYRPGDDPDRWLFLAAATRTCQLTRPQLPGTGGPCGTWSGSSTGSRSPALLRLRPDRRRM